MNDENIKISNLLKANIFIIKTAVEEVIGMEINDRTKRRPINVARYLRVNPHFLFKPTL